MALGRQSMGERLGNLHACEGAESTGSRRDRKDTRAMTLDADMVESLDNSSPGKPRDMKT